MFAVGHIALGYLAGKLVSRVLRVDLNIPAVFTLSLLPDVDLLVPWIQHRGPTHSLLFMLVAAVALAAYSPRESPVYIAALSSHSLVGDMVSDGGVQLLWPFSGEWIRIAYPVAMVSRLEVYVETGLFASMMLVMLLGGDLGRLLRLGSSGRLLFIPLATILLPAMFRYPLTVPRALVPQHLALLGIVGLSFIISLFKPAHVPGGENPGEGLGGGEDG